MYGLLSSEFSSMTGALTGDSASPDLWNALMADFRPPGYEDDVILGGIPLRAIIQVDDVARMSAAETELLVELLGSKIPGYQYGQDFGNDLRRNPQRYRAVHTRWEAGGFYE